MIDASTGLRMGNAKINQRKELFHLFFGERVFRIIDIHTHESILSLVYHFDEFIFP